MPCRPSARQSRGAARSPFPLLPMKIIRRISTLALRQDVAARMLPQVLDPPRGGLDHAAAVPAADGPYRQRKNDRAADDDRHPVMLGAAAGIREHAEAV